MSAALLREALTKVLARWVPELGSPDYALWKECSDLLAETAPYDPYAPWIAALKDPDPDVVKAATACLHRAERHPDFEYASTDTARKSETTLPPCGDGWEKNDRIPCHQYKEGVLVAEHWRNWDRFEFHETEYWMRRKARGPENVEREEDFADLAANPDDLREAVRDGVRDALDSLNLRKP